MGTRIPLKTNTELRFMNHDKGLVRYTIESELGRGGSCIVYNASYIDNTGTVKPVRIKECYPFKLNMTRKDSMELVLPEGADKTFDEYRKRFRESFEINNTLFLSVGLTNSISNPVDLYEANNTLYLVYSYLEGEPLSLHMPLSLKETAAIIRSTAAAIEKIHDRGYLYLDVKPDNIFVLNGITEVVQLFDFDSLIPLDRKEEIPGSRLSYSRGFAAFEQRAGRLQDIGKHTDVFGVGALLFYLLFGRVPNAWDCDVESDYDYSVSKYKMSDYRDKLWYTLTDFFHHTLASSWQDRYQDLREAMGVLDEIKKYGDRSLPFIYDSYIPDCRIVVGRDEEIHKLKSWYESTDETCVFVTGMGGIGKSTLVRAFLTRNRAKFDTVVYLNYSGSIQNMIADDGKLCLNNTAKMKEENTQDYFKRKLAGLRRVVEGTKTVIVIDNFDGVIEEEFLSLLNIGWRVIVVTRMEISGKDYSVLNVQAIRKQEDLQRLFAENLGREISEKEVRDVDNIINGTCGHTLVVELMARQIAMSYLSVAEGARLAKELGFSNLAPEKVRYVKDGKTYYDKLSDIIMALFAAENMLLTKKVILKILSLLPITGIDIHIFEKMIRLDSKDDINELKEEGWIYVNEGNVSLHPVVRETIRLWQWNDEYERFVLGVMKHLFVQIELESKRKECSKVFHKYLQLAESVLDSCRDVSELYKTEIYKDLLYRTIINMPSDREDYILSRSEELFSAGGYGDGEKLIKLFDYVVYIYCAQGKLKQAYDKLMEAKKVVKRSSGNYLWGIYYGALGDYYDALLNGSYGARTKRNRRLVSLLLESTDQGIHCMKRAKEPDGKEYLAKYYLSKASILVRNYPERRGAIKRALNSAHMVIGQDLPEFSELRINYGIICGWYYTLAEPDYERTVELDQKVYETAKRSLMAELDIIDYVLVPSANMMAEWGESEEAKRWLETGIDICQRHEDSLPYMRKKTELYEHLQEIGY